MAYDAKDIKLLKKVGAKLRKIRLEKGWTLEEVEDHGWSNWRHLQKIETGGKNLTIITLKKLSELYKIKIFQIFEDL